MSPALIYILTVGGLVVAVVGVILTIYAIKKVATRRDVREEIRAAGQPGTAISEKDEPLVSYKEFYGDEIGERHDFEFVGERSEPVRVGDEVGIEKSRPLQAVLGFIAGTEQVLAICGSGGLGKSRL